MLPSDIASLLRPGQIRHTVLTNPDGDTLDDLVVTHAGDHLFIIVNAATRESDFAYMRATLSNQIHLTELTDRALLALQGPEAAAVMERLVPDLPFKTDGMLPFMSAVTIPIAGIPC